LEFFSIASSNTLSKMFLQYVGFGRIRRMHSGLRLNVTVICSFKLVSSLEDPLLTLDLLGELEEPLVMRPPLF
jgi:hypothetical protein